MTDVAKLQIQVDSEPALKAAQNLAALDKAAGRVVAQAKNLKEAKLGKSATTGGADFKNLTKPVQEAAQEIEKYVLDLQKTSGKVSGVKTDLAAVAGDFGKIATAVQGLSAKDVSDNFETLAENIKKFATELRGAVPPLKASAKLIKAFKDNSKGLVTRVGNLADRFEKLRRGTAFSARNLRRAEAAAKTADTTFDNLRSSVGNTAAEIGRLENQTERAERSQRRLKSQITGVGGASLRASNFVRQLATGLGLVSGGFALAQGARAFVRTLAEFEFQAAKTAAVAIKLKDAIDQTRVSFTEAAQQQRALIDQARALGASTRFTAVEAAEAQFFLARAGFDVLEVIEATPATLNLAAAGYLDLGRAADIASNVLQQFQLETTQLADVTDALVFTANNANTSVEQLAQALAYAGPFAASLGVTVNEAAAAVGALGNAGIQGSLAGTNFRGILVSLISPSREAGEELDKLGKRLEGFSGREAFDVTNKSLLEVIENLGKATENSEDASKEFAKIFNRRNVSGALALSRNVESLQGLLGGLADDLGTAERVRQFVDDTLVGALQRARSAAAELTLAIGEGGFGKGLREFVDDFAKALRVLSGGETALANITERSLAFSRVIKGVTAAVGGFIAAGAALATVGFGLKFLTSIGLGIGAIRAFSKSVADSIKKDGFKVASNKVLALSFTDVAKAATKAGIASTALSVTNPVFAIATAAAAVVAYSTDLFGLVNASEDATDAQREFADAVTRAKKALEEAEGQAARLQDLETRLARIGGLIPEQGLVSSAVITELEALKNGIRAVNTEAAGGDIPSLVRTVEAVVDPTDKAREGLDALLESLRELGSDGNKAANEIEKSFEKARATLERSPAINLQLDLDTERAKEATAKFAQSQRSVFESLTNDALDLFSATGPFSGGIGRIGVRNLPVNTVVDVDDNSLRDLRASLNTILESSFSEEELTSEAKGAIQALIDDVVGVGDEAGKRILEGLAPDQFFVGVGAGRKELEDTTNALTFFREAIRLTREELAGGALASLAAEDVTSVLGDLERSVALGQQVAANKKARDEKRRQDTQKALELELKIDETREKQTRELAVELEINRRLEGLSGAELATAKKRLELQEEIAEAAGRELFERRATEDSTKRLNSIVKTGLTDAFAEAKSGGGFRALFEGAVGTAKDVGAELKNVKFTTEETLTAEAERLLAEREAAAVAKERLAISEKEAENVQRLIRRLGARKTENQRELDDLRRQLDLSSSLTQNELVKAQIARELDKIDFSKQFGKDGELIDNENLVEARRLLDPIFRELDDQRRERAGLKLVLDAAGQLESLNEQLAAVGAIRDANSGLSAEELSRNQLALAGLTKENAAYDELLKKLTFINQALRESQNILDQEGRSSNLKDLDEEIVALQLRIRQGGELTAQQEAEARARKEGARGDRDYIEGLASRIQVIRDLEKVLKDVTDRQTEFNSASSSDFGDFIRGYREQTEALLIQAGVVRELTVEEEALRIARDNNFSSSTLPRIEREVAARRNAQQALEDFNEKVRQAQAEQRALQQAQQRLSNSLADVIVNAKSAEEAFLAFAKQIAAAIIQAKIFQTLGTTGLFEKDGLIGSFIVEGVPQQPSKVAVEEEFRQAATEDFQVTRLVTEEVLNPAPLNVTRVVTEEVVQSPDALRAEAGRQKARAQRDSLLRAQQGPFGDTPVEVPVVPVPAPTEIDPSRLFAAGDYTLVLPADVEIPGEAALDVQRDLLNISQERFKLPIEAAPEATLGAEGRQSLEALLADSRSQIGAGLELPIKPTLGTEGRQSLEALLADSRSQIEADLEVPVKPIADDALSEATGTAALTTAGTTVASAITAGATTASGTLTAGATGASTALNTGATTAAGVLTGGGSSAAAAIIQGATTAAAILTKASAATSAASGGGGFFQNFLSALGFGSYKGNVVSNGIISNQYYRGGIPFLDQLPRVGNTPASFLGMDGSINTLREGGSQEAILPLSRDGSGRLGVRMVGGESGNRTNVSTTNNTTVQNFNLSVPDDTFGMSERQRQRKVARFSRR